MYAVQMSSNHKIKKKMKNCLIIKKIMIINCSYNKKFKIILMMLTDIKNICIIINNF